MTRVLLAFAALLLLPISDAAAQPAKAVKVTVLSTMLVGSNGVGEWGFAAVLEVDGRRLPCRKASSIRAPGPMAAKPTDCCR